MPAVAVAVAVAGAATPDGDGASSSTRLADTVTVVSLAEPPDALLRDRSGDGAEPKHAANIRGAVSNVRRAGAARPTRRRGRRGDGADAATRRRTRAAEYRGVRPGFSEPRGTGAAGPGGDVRRRPRRARNAVAGPVVLAAAEARLPAP